MSVQIVDPLEMIEVEDKQHARGLQIEHFAERAHQFAAIGEAGAGIGIRIALGEPLRCFISLESLFEVLRPAPAEQDDGDIEQEGDLEGARAIERRHL